jgi:hypothetical protein
MESLVQGLELSATAKVLNHAWDKQISKEAHFDILTQQPKRGHIHEVMSRPSDGYVE